MKARVQTLSYVFLIFFLLLKSNCTKTKDIALLYGSLKPVAVRSMITTWMRASRELREVQWQGELQSFEQKLFALVCDYGAALRALPDNEHLTLVLKGLGSENENRREDRIHVLAKEQLQGCLQGSVSSSALQSGALTYSF